MRESEMTADYIKMCVACYFRFARGCPVVTIEYWHYQDSVVQQDVLVLDKHNRPIEIEVKISLSDFKADAKKHIWSFRNRGERWPWKFWYAIPADLVPAVEPLLREGVGLLSVDHYEHGDRPGNAVAVVHSAPPHKEYEVVTEARYKRIIAAQSASLCTALRKREAEHEA